MLSCIILRKPLTFFMMTKGAKSNSISASSLFSLDKTEFSTLFKIKAPFCYENNGSDGESRNSFIQGIGKLKHLSSSSFRLPLTFESRCNKNPKYVFILVGLPAVGKSSTSSHLVKYLSKQSFTKDLRFRVYNAGKVRRSISCQDLGHLSTSLTNDSNEDLFNPKNYGKKERYAKITLKNLLEDLNSDKCDVAFFDATNSTVDRRRFVFQEICSYNLTPNKNICIVPIVLQISCNDHRFIRFNVHNKAFNADYYDKPYEYSVRDFTRRLKNYYLQFAPFTKHEFSNLIDSFIPMRGLDYGAFCFNILNAGTLTTRDDNFGFLPKQKDHVQNIIGLVARFCENYTKLFGYSYVDAVDDFFVRENRCHSKHLSVLNSVISDDFLNELQNNLNSNKR